MRATYRARRDTLVATLAEALPEAEVRGIAAGLHATVELPAGVDEAAVLAACAERRIALETVTTYRFGDAGGPPTLLLGYAKMPEATIRAGVREVALAVEDARSIV